MNLEAGRTVSVQIVDTATAQARLVVGDQCVADGDSAVIVAQTAPEGGRVPRNLAVVKSERDIGSVKADGASVRTRVVSDDLDGVEPQHRGSCRSDRSTASGHRTVAHGEFFDVDLAVRDIEDAVVAVAVDDGVCRSGPHDPEWVAVVDNIEIPLEARILASCPQGQEVGSWPEDDRVLLGIVGSRVHGGTQRARRRTTGSHRIRRRRDGEHRREGNLGREENRRKGEQGKTNCDPRRESRI